MQTQEPPVSFDVELAHLRDAWGWLITVGVALIALGAAAIIFGVGTTGSSALLGVILIAACLLETYITAQTFTRRRGVTLVLVRALEFGAGISLLLEPETYTGVPLLVPLFLIAHGAFRLWFAATIRLSHRIFFTVAGAVTFASGVALAIERNPTGAAFVGPAIGVNYVTLGVFWVLIAAKLRRRQR